MCLFCLIDHLSNFLSFCRMKIRGYSDPSELFNRILQILEISYDVRNGQTELADIDITRMNIARCAIK